jgi:peptidoglycan/LPS O-acetylase OafA/YrhL
MSSFSKRRSNSEGNLTPFGSLIFAIATALASYFLLEKPLLKLRWRLHPD